MRKYNKSPGEVELLLEKALSSKAVDHPYLKGLREGAFPDMEQVIRDFAFQYGGYSSGFINYVDAAIEGLSQQKHRDVLYENLAEEKGNFDPSDAPPELKASIAGVPHSLLFRQFQESLGINDHYRKSADYCASVLSWRRQFLALCQQDQCVAVGALGIGTELLVSRIYADLLIAIENYTDLQPRDYIFFSLHTECDDGHAEDLIQIARELAIDKESCAKISYGVERAIELRVNFWQELYQQARNTSNTTPLAGCSELSFGH